MRTVFSDIAVWQNVCSQFLSKLKKVRKTTRPFRYDLNQIPYNYTMEVRIRFKGLDLIECLKNYGWRFMTLWVCPACYLSAGLTPRIFISSLIVNSYANKARIHRTVQKKIFMTQIITMV